ncbi:hypothetical protein GMOD_00004447 [Pyrenophora seminiperda CCB06]|uniref:Uncharacterized protein n=1 Tax=Pyrenophora seminiperda CCB06 TaxID=1302712 RepID=A0A3M7M1F2_9PLEO|nr:hypothetical protein GMOD_00004447 [Pyrenophora seminiperda CCB06]
MASFASLPPEIRLEIYSYMAIPLTTPFITWHGLYLSNRTIRAEMDAECGKILRAYLVSKAAKMANRVQEVGRVVGARDCEQDELLLPGTFLQMQNLRIRLGTCKYMWRRGWPGFYATFMTHDDVRVAVRID